MHPFELIRELASIDKIRLTVAHREFVRAFKSLKSLSIYFDGNFMMEGRPFNADQLAANLMEELSYWIHCIKNPDVLVPKLESYCQSSGIVFIQFEHPSSPINLPSVSPSGYRNEFKFEQFFQRHFD